MSKFMTSMAVVLLLFVSAQAQSIWESDPVLRQRIIEAKQKDGERNRKNAPKQQLTFPVSEVDEFNARMQKTMPPNPNANVGAPDMSAVNRLENMLNTPVPSYQLTIEPQRTYNNTQILLVPIVPYYNTPLMVAPTGRYHTPPPIYFIPRR